MTQDKARVLHLVDDEAETSVLAAMLRGGDSLATALAQQLEEADFYDQRRRLVFRGVQAVLMGIEPVTPHAVIAECRRLVHSANGKGQDYNITSAYLESLVGDKAKAGKYTISLKKLAWLRQAGDFAFEYIKRLQMNPAPDEFFAWAQSEFQLMSPRRQDKVILYGWETIAFTEDMLRQQEQAAKTGAVHRFDWPWASWNVRGVRPMLPGLVGVIGAADGIGKSTYLDYIAEHWAQRGNRVVLFHFEDTHKYKLNRRLARHSRVPLDVIEDARYDPVQRQAITEANRLIASWADKLHYVHCRGWTMNQLAAEAKKLKDEGECDAIIIDYIDKAEADNRQLKQFGTNIYPRQGDDAEKLKRLAEQLDVPAMTATQGNKGMQDHARVKTRQDIEGSGQKSQRSQLVVILTRDLVGSEGLRDSNGNLIANPGDYSPIVNVRVDKQNRGKTFTLQQVLRGDCYRIGDLAREEPQP